MVSIVYSHTVNVNTSINHTHTQHPHKHTHTHTEHAFGMLQCISHLNIMLLVHINKTGVGNKLASGRWVGRMDV